MLVENQIFFVHDVYVCREIVGVDYHIVSCHLVKVGARFRSLEEVVLLCIMLGHRWLLSRLEGAHCSLSGIPSLDRDLVLRSKLDLG